MESPDFFAPLPLSMDPQSKQVSTSSPNPSLDLTEALGRLNTTHRALQSIDPPNLLAPPPPQPPFVNPKRSQQIQKLREAAQTTSKKQSSQQVWEPSSSPPQSETLKLYSLALDMALQRPTWEPQQLLREELAGIYTARASTHGSMRAWADAYTDCRLSLECKAQGNPGAWRIGCDALSEMGRRAEAVDWVRRAVAQEENTLVQLRNQVGQLQQGHPGQAQAKSALQGFEKELETLREQAKSLGAL